MSVETKVYERTEDGTVTHVSIREAMAEVNHAMMSGKRDVQEMSSGRSQHRIDYRDGRSVRLVLVDTPAEQPAETDAWTVAGHKTLLHRFTQADEDGRALCNKSFRPHRYGNGYSFKTKAEHQSSKYAHLYQFCPRCEAK